MNRAASYGSRRASLVALQEDIERVPVADFQPLPAVPTPGIATRTRERVPRSVAALPAEDDDWDADTQTSYVSALRELAPPLPQAAAAAASYAAQVPSPALSVHASPAAQQNARYEDEDRRFGNEEDKEERDEAAGAWRLEGVLAAESVLWIGDPDRVFFNERRCKSIGKNLDQFLERSSHTPAGDVQLFGKGDGALVALAQEDAPDADSAPLKQNVHLYSRRDPHTGACVELRLKLRDS